MVEITTLLDEARKAVRIVVHVLDELAEREITADDAAALGDLGDELWLLGWFAGCVQRSITTVPRGSTSD